MEEGGHLFVRVAGVASADGREEEPVAGACDCVFVEASDADGDVVEVPALVGRDFGGDGVRHAGASFADAGLCAPVEAGGQCGSGPVDSELVGAEGEDVAPVVVGARVDSSHA